MARAGRKSWIGRIGALPAAVVVAASLLVIAPTIVPAEAAAAPAREPPVGLAPHSDADEKPAHPVRRSCAEPAKEGHAACLALMRTDVPATTGLAAADPQGYGPAELQDAYDLPSDTAGEGALVAIVDAFDHPRAEEDLAVYRQQFGLAPCTSGNGCFTKVNQRGQQGDYPRPDAGWAQEISLDLDMVSAACPRCRLLLVVADSTGLDDLGQAVNTAVQLGAKYVSNSYGSSPESAAHSRYNAYYDHPGVVITASSGDYGYGVSFPAASPLVTAVGGTSLVADPSARGWAETVWAGAGSGCSRFEPKPEFQADADCPNRTVADVSAVADPETGVAMYNTYGLDGWAVFGGTSASAPLIAATYALAGEPAADTRPNSYPYDKPGSLFDVTAGNNGDCDGSYLCTGTTGFDGPTGLGTPNGVSAFGTGPHGTLAGAVTDFRRQPVVGAKVTAGGRSVIAGSDGRYTLRLLAGTYDVTVSAFGYRDAAENGVVVGDDAHLTADFRLATLPTATVSGTVRDGSGHGWPLYAELTIDGVPGGPVLTDPMTGRYRVELPRSASYTMHVSSTEAGYRTKDVTVAVGRSDVTADVDVPVDAEECAAAPGYGYDYDGVATDFAGWTGTAPQDGWTVTDAEGNGQTWAFDDPGGRGNLTGGEGEFATLDADAYGPAHGYDTALVSPPVDLSAQDDPVVGFRSDYRSASRSRISVDLSTDGGTTWTSIWKKNVGDQNGMVAVPIPQAAGEPDVRVRFHYDGFWSWWWQLDDVYVGSRSCEPVSGGLVSGVVKDRNTGEGINGVTVRGGGGDGSGGSAVSVATPEDGRVSDGLYRLFLPGSGRQALTATYGMYQPRTERPSVGPDRIERQDFSLAAGRLEVRQDDVSVDLPLGEDRSTRVMFTNKGSVPAHVVLDEQDGGNEPAEAAGRKADAEVPVRRVKGDYSPERHVAATSGATRARQAEPASTPYAGPWQPASDYPIPITDQGAAAIGGKIYSVGGFDGTTDVRSGYRYDPVAQTWSPIADMPTAREGMQVAAIAGKLYVAGGWAPDGTLPAGTDVYDPVTDTWSSVAANPAPRAFAATTTLDGKMYVVGGCRAQGCTPEVTVYDPGEDSWTRVANYPFPVSFAACGGIDGRLYCAGGLVPDVGHGFDRPTASGSSYDPASDTWTAIPDMPHDFWGSSYGAANGELLVSGGIILTSTTLTNEGVAYDPAAGAWHALPNSMHALYRGAATCGFYKIGGGTSDDDPAWVESEVLPGYDRCGTTDVPWLSTDRTELDVPAHRSVSVRVTLDSAAATGFGDYRAWLAVSTNTPYVMAPIEVTMRVERPRTWGEITGTVTGRECSGDTSALAGAPVWVDGRDVSYPLTTDAQGHYSLWLDQRHNPLSVIATKDGYRPKSATAHVRPGRSTTQDFALQTAKTCG
ncbi:MAG: galactose oxidase [Actinophytocola sp.]|uniref:carboxypeptidase regulatory-like domain-containing protein n=1 Tax=Actinophytocola sp. TaxID=1872138 RepID=UPI0013243E69|nr:carboxypeptidase regulatory-like domain-containing protein [Actinophytocola sp.]MPZ86323.1 galactose oxidase [Actinophytocola sp.]